jgi:NAD+ synthase
LNQDILSEIKNQDYTRIIQNIEEFIDEKIKSTNSQGVILGLSGGIDSALIAYICKNKFKGKDFSSNNA